MLKPAAVSSVEMSTLTKNLIEEIKAAPETVQREVFDFLVFLKARESAQPGGQKDRLAQAAEALLADYTSDPELTAFTGLDDEPFHA